MPGFPHDQRRNRRYHYLKSFEPAKLVHVNSEREILAEPLDISRIGLGCIVNLHVEVGDVIVLEFPNRMIRLIVRNCVPTVTNKDKYRCGLEIVEDNCDLHEIYPHPMVTP